MYNIVNSTYVLFYYINSTYSLFYVGKNSDKLGLKTFASKVCRSFDSKIFLHRAERVGK